METGMAVGSWHSHVTGRVHGPGAWLCHYVIVDWKALPRSSGSGLVGGRSWKLHPLQEKGMSDAMHIERGSLNTPSIRNTEYACMGRGQHLDGLTIFSTRLEYKHAGRSGPRESANTILAPTYSLTRNLEKQSTEMTRY